MTDSLQACIVFWDEIGPIAELTVDASKALAVVVWANGHRIVDLTDVTGREYQIKSYTIKEIRGTDAHRVDVHMVTFVDHAKRVKRLECMPDAMTWQEYEEKHVELPSGDMYDEEDDE